MLPVGTPCLGLLQCLLCGAGRPQTLLLHFIPEIQSPPSFDCSSIQAAMGCSITAIQMCVTSMQSLSSRLTPQPWEEHSRLTWNDGVSRKVWIFGHNLCCTRGFQGCTHLLCNWSTGAGNETGACALEGTHLQIACPSRNTENRVWHLQSIFIVIDTSLLTRHPCGWWGEPHSTMRWETQPLANPPLQHGHCWCGATEAKRVPWRQMLWVMEWGQQL